MDIVVVLSVGLGEKAEQVSELALVDGAVLGVGREQRKPAVHQYRRIAFDIAVGVPEVEPVIGDEARDAAESEVVGSLGPTQVFAELMNRRDARQAGAGRVNGVDIAQPGKAGVQHTGIFLALPRVTVAETAGQVGVKQRGVADGIAFAVFEKHAGRGLAGKLRNAVGEIVVLQVAAPEDAMLAFLIELVVELGNVGVPA